MLSKLWIPIVAVSLLMLGVYLGGNAPSYGQDELTVSVSREEALEKALQLAKKDMEWIGVEGINWTKATLVNVKLSMVSHQSVLGHDVYKLEQPYYVWSVEIQYDKHYVRPDGAYWVVGYAVIIRPDTGEILDHGEQGHEYYGPRQRPPAGDTTLGRSV